MNSDVFIAYSRKDARFAEAVDAYLQRRGLSCYRDVKSIPGSAEWMTEITAAIDGCHAVMAILSPDAVLSDHVKREVAIAAEANKGFVPVWLSEDIKLPQNMRYALAGHQRVMAIASLDEALPSVEAAAWRTVDRSRNRAAYDDESSLREADRITHSREVNFALDRCGLPLGEFDCGTATIEGGAYVMQAKPRDYLGFELTALPRSSEFILESRIAKLEGPDDSWFGFEFGERFPGDYYQFLLNGQGSVRVSKHRNRVWRDLACHRNVRQCGTGNTDNSLRVIRKGPGIHVFVNGRHALSVADRDIHSGGLGMVVGWGIRAAFRDLSVSGVSLGAIFDKAIGYWRNLQVLEARELLRYVQEFEPAYKHPGWTTSIGQLLWETRPDRRKSVLIVVGYQVSPQLHDGLVAARLREEINRRGHPQDLECAFVVTDTGLLEEEVFLECSLIAIGAPSSNKLTRVIADKLPLDAASTAEVRVQHDLAKGDRRVALWGGAGEETVKAADLFLSSGLLDRFLSMLWERQVLKP